MGLDGGTIPTRSDLLRGASWKLNQSDTSRSTRGGNISNHNFSSSRPLTFAEKAAAVRVKMGTCAISGEPLGKEVCGCARGNLYNRESLYKMLLQRAKKREGKESRAAPLSSSSSMPPDSGKRFGHIRSMKDTFLVNGMRLAAKREGSGNTEAEGRSRRGLQQIIERGVDCAEIWQCPITGVFANGKRTFVVLVVRPCGHMFSERALSAVCPQWKKRKRTKKRRRHSQQSAKEHQQERNGDGILATCMICSSSFQPDMRDVIVLAGGRREDEEDGDSATHPSNGHHVNVEESRDKQGNDTAQQQQLRQNVENDRKDHRFPNPTLEENNNKNNNDNNNNNNDIKPDDIPDKGIEKPNRLQQQQQDLILASSSSSKAIVSTKPQKQQQQQPPTPLFRCGSEVLSLASNKKRWNKAVVIQVKWKKKKTQSKEESTTSMMTTIANHADHQAPRREDDGFYIYVVEYDNGHLSRKKESELKALQRMLCPEKHRLEKFLTDTKGFDCNVCKRINLPEGHEMYGCRICDWDACYACYEAHNAKKAQEPSSVPQTTERVYHHQLKNRKKKKNKKCRKRRRLLDERQKRELLQAMGGKWTTRY